MKLLKKKVPALFLLLLVVLSLTVPALAASSTDTAAAPAAAETAQTQSDATGSKSIAAGIAIGLAFILTGAFQHTEFQRSHPFIQDLSLIHI